MGALVLAFGAGWFTYRHGGWLFPGVLVAMTSVVTGIIVLTGRPLDVTPVPVVAVVAVGSCVGLLAHRRLPNR
jgi:hypothetical protein